MNNNDTILSILITSTYSSDSLKNCLSSIRKQIIEKGIEVIVANTIKAEKISETITDHPEVSFFHFPERTPIPKLLGKSIEISRGQIIAITESTCQADLNWISAILKAHKSEHPVIGGAVEMIPSTEWVDWAAYFCEYAQFMHPLKEGVIDQLPGNNISTKRLVLEGEYNLDQLGFWKTHWCRKLQGRGIELFSIPSIIVYQRKTYRLKHFLERRFHNGRCFAGMRVANCPKFSRLLLVIGAPLLPFLFLGRIIKTVLQKKRYLREFVISFPISILAVVVWSFGELCGYCAGAGNSCSNVID